MLSRNMGPNGGRCVSYFHTIYIYLHSKGVDYLPLATFRGNRLNILFHNAAGVFFLQDHLASFFEEYSTENSLLEAVAAD